MCVSVLFFCVCVNKLTACVGAASNEKLSGRNIMDVIHKDVDYFEKGIWSLFFVTVLT